MRPHHLLQPDNIFITYVHFNVLGLDLVLGLVLGLVLVLRLGLIVLVLVLVLGLGEEGLGHVKNKTRFFR